MRQRACDEIPNELRWVDDDDLFEKMRSHLYSAVIGDILDELKLFHQILPPNIRPLHPDMIIVGRAMTVLEADVFGGEYPDCSNPVLSQPFGLMMEALDSLQKNEVYICTGASPDFALTGELMCLRARYCGAAGMIVDGYARDTREIMAMHYPVFALGSYTQDQGPRGKVIGYRIPIKMGAVTINPGDILFGDIDGIVVVPKEHEIEVLQKAYAKAIGENVVRQEIVNGMPALEAFRKYGIL